jgi:hypothetical protein
MCKYPHQKVFFDRLRPLLARQYNLANWLTVVLEITNSTAHKKLRGEVAVGFDELAAICKVLPEAAFLIPELLQLQEGMVALRTRFSQENYLEQLLSQLLKLLQALDKSGSGHLKLIWRDLPMFVLLAKPVLLHFKLHFWKQVPLFGSLPENILQMAQAIWQLYQQIPSDEIWYSGAIEHFQAQLNFAINQKWIQDYQKDGVERALRSALHLFNNMHESHPEKRLYIQNFCLGPSSGIFGTHSEKLLITSAADGKYLFSKDEELIEQFHKVFENMGNAAAPLSSKPFFQNTVFD